MDNLLALQTTLVEGYRVASGRAKDSPYPAGSISLQVPYFKALGFDLSGCLAATLNLSVAPFKFELLAADHRFEKVHWYPHTAPETFSFVSCLVEYDAVQYHGWIYYPHPETKPAHFQSPSTFEVLCPFIPDLDYGAKLILRFSPHKIRVLQP